MRNFQGKDRFHFYPHPPELDGSEGEADVRGRLPLVDALFNAHPNLTEAWEYVVTDDCTVKKTQNIFICKGNIKELFFGETFTGLRRCPPPQPAPRKSANSAI